MHATSGSVGTLASIIVDWLRANQEHLSKSEFSQVATRVRESATADGLFRTKRAPIDYAASYPDPQCRIGETVEIKAVGGVFNGDRVVGTYACWNPLSGRTAIESDSQQVSGFFVRKVTTSADLEADADADAA